MSFLGSVSSNSRRIGLKPKVMTRVFGQVLTSYLLTFPFGAIRETTRLLCSGPEGTRRIRMTGPLTSCEVVKQKVNISRAVAALNNCPYCGESTGFSSSSPLGSQVERLSRRELASPVSEGRPGSPDLQGENTGTFALWAACSHFQGLGRNVCPWVIRRSFSLKRLILHVSEGPPRFGGLGGERGLVALITVFIKSPELGLEPLTLLRSFGDALIFFLFRFPHGEPSREQGHVDLRQ